jgi:P-type conjugative transfer protein TrbJ
MKKRALSVAALVVTATLTVDGARAQFVVIDPANLIQNIFTAARSLVQIQNQIQQLVNEAKNLESLRFNSLTGLQATLAQLSRLIGQAQGLSFQLNQATQQFSRLYPNGYAGVPRSQMDADAQTRWVNSHEALRTAVVMQAQANTNLTQDQALLADLVNNSQGAAGALQAIQATNQLLALNAKHLMQMQQMGVTQDRSVTAENARAVEAQARTLEFRQRFMTPVTAYTPQDVTGIN